MRTIPHSIALSALLLPVAALAGAPALERRVEVSLQPALGRVEVVDRITGAARVEQFRLNERASGLVATVAGEPVDIDQGRGIFRLPEAVPEGAVLHLEYQLELTSEPSPERPFLGARGGFLPGWSAWLASFDERRSTFELTLEIPKPYVAVATGDLLEDDRSGHAYRASFRTGRSLEPPSLFTGRYRIRERRVSNVRYRTYFTERTEGFADLYLERSHAYLARFEEQIGPYPYGGFAVVAAPIPVGLGFPGLAYVSERILPLPFMQTRSLAHEVLHSWFGNAVEVDYDRGNWAEGLTTYLADHGILDDPAEQRAMRLGWLRDYNALPPERDIVPTSFVTKAHDADQIVGYDKVAFVFHMLRRRLGDAAFEAGLRTFYREHRFRRAAWSDLEASFEAASGRDLRRFFAQWLERPGAAALAIEHAGVTPGAGGFEIDLQLAQEEAPYDLIVPLEVITGSGVERHVLPIAQAGAATSLHVRARPRRLVVDPDYDLFRRLVPGEAPLILRDLLLDPATQTVIQVDDRASREAARGLAEALLGRTVEIDAVIDGGRNDGPLLVVGTGQAVDRALARLGTEPPPQAAGAGTASVWTTARVDAEPLLVIRADDRAAIEALARPLPHYRRDSWLRFEGARLLARGLWPAGPSALTVDFD